MAGHKMQDEPDTVFVFTGWKKPRSKPASDICIVLFHNNKKVKPGGSILGLCLVAALEEVGLVNHTIWQKIHR